MEKREITKADLEATIQETAAGIRFREAVPKGLDYRRVFVEITRRPEMNRRFREARKMAARLLVDEAVTIADGPEGEREWVRTRTIRDGKGNVLRVIEDRSPNVDRDRLRVGMRQWLAARMAPEDFGERVTMAGDAESPPEFVFRVIGETARKALPEARDEE